MIESLAGIQKLYVDANILIYLFEESPSFRKSVLAAFEIVQANRIRVYTSELTLTECLGGAFRYGNQTLVQRYLDVISDPNFLNLVPMQLEICIEAARLGAEYRLKTIDSIHLATSIMVKCDGFLTNDLRFKTNDSIRVFQLSQFIK